MEILTPIQPTESPQRTDIPEELSEAGITLKNVSFMDFLGIKDAMFDSSVMEKVSFLTENLADTEVLMDLDIRLGEGKGMTKLDKLYSYLKLNQHADKIREHERLIREQMRKYESGE